MGGMPIRLCKGSIGDILKAPVIFLIPLFWATWRCSTRPFWFLLVYHTSEHHTVYKNRDDQHVVHFMPVKEFKSTDRVAEQQDISYCGACTISHDTYMALPVQVPIKVDSKVIEVGYRHDSIGFWSGGYVFGAMRVVTYKVSVGTGFCEHH